MPRSELFIGLVLPYIFLGRGFVEFPIIVKLPLAEIGGLMALVVPTFLIGDLSVEFEYELVILPELFIALLKLVELLFIGLDEVFVVLLDKILLVTADLLKLLFKVGFDVKLVDL